MFYMWFDGKHIQLFHVSLVVVCAQMNNKYFPNLSSRLMQFQATTLKMWVNTTINQWENQLNWIVTKRKCYKSTYRARGPFFMPPPLGAGGIMFTGCLSVRPIVCPKPEITSFHLYMGPLVQLWPFFGMSPSVCPSGEVSGHLLENAWREWSEILHVNVSWKPSELIRLWSWSVDFLNCGTILT